MAIRSRRSVVTGGGPIAIVGVACRFPGADGLEAFWQLLVSRKDAVGEVDADRWATRFFYHPQRTEPGKSYTWAAGLIEGIDKFEPSFFGISPREAVQMDPQQRILLELVWHALEDAGIPPSRFGGSDTGVYIGASATDYSDLCLGDPATADPYFMVGNALSIIANRISYVFDLRGPSLTVDTACSSSLVALHQACEAIRGGRISSAIVGGVNLLLTPYPFLGFCRASMLSPKGRCFAFDERADGYVRGEGGGVVILKPLAEAVADHDPVRAVVLATGSNSDGRTIGLSLPNEAAQIALLQSVYEEAGIAADDLAYFEMHGTGTPVGDPIEAAAVGRTLGQRRREPLPIGSVKTNIGHLEPASGMAGLLKAALAIERGVLPPSLHCESPNPKIDFAALNLRLVRKVEPVLMSPERRIAGVNSFGFGGSNAHVVLAAPPQPKQPADLLASPPLVISAATEVSLRALAGSWQRSLNEVTDEQMPGLLCAAARGRDHQRHRLAVQGIDRHKLANALGRFQASAATSEIITGTAVSGAQLAFVFSGNGAQFPGMGRAVLRTNADFRAAVEAVDNHLCAELGWSVAARMEDGVDATVLARADIAQPLIFAIQVGIVSALRANGVVASGHFGHSVGEIAAAWSAGALSLADAARVVIARSRSQQRTYGKGRMAALALGCKEAAEFLAEIGCAAEIAALNAAQSVTVSGTGEEIEQLVANARRRSIWCRPLDLDFAFHSRLMEPVQEELLASLDGLASQPPVGRFASTVTGAIIDGERLGAEHWWRNIRDPVRFAEATAAMIAGGYRIFLEVGPYPILRSYLTDGLQNAQAEGRVLATLSRNDASVDPFPGIAARCYVAGYDWPSTTHFDGPANPRGLPLYAWDRQTFWFDKTAEDREFLDPPLDHPLLGFRQRGHAPAWLNYLDQEVLPWIGDHAVEGLAVFPAAAVIEMALAAARWRWPEAAVLEALNIEIRRPLPFEKGRMRELRNSLTSDDGDWELMSRPRLSEEPMTQHAVGRVAVGARSPVSAHWADAAVNADRIDNASLYRLAAAMGLQYGAGFRTVDRVEVLDVDRAIVRLNPPAIDEPLDSYLLHPALLDGALQGMLALQSSRGQAVADACFLPSRFERVRLVAPFGRVCRRAQLRLTRVGVRSASADLALYDESDDMVAELTGCWFRRVELNRRASPGERTFHVDLLAAPLGQDEAPAVLHEAGRLFCRIAATRTPDRARHDEGPLLEAFIGAAASRLWRAFQDSRRSFSIRELVGDGRISSNSAALADCLLRSAERLGGASEVHGEWQLAAEPDLPDSEEIWRLLLADAPDLVGELALSATTLEEIPRILVKGPSPLRLSTSAMLDHLLQASPASVAGINFLCEALEAMSAQWPVNRPLRILEIGGDGVVTERLLQRLAKFSTTATYLATSGDPAQVDRLSAVTQRYSGGSACHWAPGFPSGAIGNARFDIVVAVNACARLHLDSELLAALRDLIVPGGFFLAVEPEPNSLWDVVFGQCENWWISDRSGCAASPMRSCEEWQSELAAAGFEAAGGVELASGAWPAAAFWASAPRNNEPAATEATTPYAIALIGEDMPLRRALVDRLRSVGHLVTVAMPSSDAAIMHDPGSTDGVPEIVMFLAGAAAAGAGVARQIAALVQIAHAAAKRCAMLWLVTGDVHQATSGVHNGDLAGGALWGFARVLANELPSLPIRMIDVASAAGVNSQARQIAEEIGAATPESEIVRTSHGRCVPRLRAGLPPLFAPPDEPVKLAVGSAGGLNSPGWTPRRSQPLGPRDVEIEVRAAGLNFRDLMWAMGILPEEALVDGFAGAAFGIECAGFVRAIGADVEGLRVGDRVMAFAPEALATRAVTIADAVAPIPAGLSFAAAATLPVAFVTVIYALANLAQLEQGECLLVHAAAGGVGLAAIQYAKHRGAVVIATAGSAIKRTFLRLAGADHVLDSRDLGFADAVREITGGEGVDVVLNSLSGEAMDRSLEVLKPFGRFLELGKRDFYLNRRLHLRPFRKNVSFFAIDVDQLPLRRPALARSLLAEISTLLEQGVIRPLAYREFGYSEVDAAFRLMQASGHIGKLVLFPDLDGKLPLREPPDFAARGDGTYLVSGGVEGFGFETARWLVAHGAGAIALLGRRGAETPGCRERIGELRSAGADVRVYGCDVADRDALAEVLCRIRAMQPPLRGVVHAASTVDDRLTADIDPIGIEQVLRPKLDGALALDELTRDDPIELFLLFSSATTILGAPGQGGYVAANMALETLARRRHAEGRPALAVAWGPIEDAGYLAERPEMREALARRLGAIPMPAAQALAALPAMLASGLPVIAYAEANWGEAKRFLPVLATPLFSEIRFRGDASPNDEPLADRLRELDPEAAQGLLQSVLTDEVARILRLSASDIDASRPLSQMGMDSLMAIELRLALENRLAIDLPLVSLAEGTSIASIAVRLAAALMPAPEDTEIMALVARHESFDAFASPTISTRAAPKTVAD